MIVSFLKKEGWEVNVKYHTHTSYVHSDFKNLELLVSRNQADIMAWFDRGRTICIECENSDCKKAYKTLMIICTYIKMIENGK